MADTLFWYIIYSMSTKIYIIEDEPVMRQSLADLLAGSGYETDALVFEERCTLRKLDQSTPHDHEQSAPRELERSASFDLETIVEQILAAKPDLLLLDINLPGLNGEQLLKTLRQTSELPVIMVTSSSSEMDEVLSMSYGADDYITKPYSPQVLLLRIAAVLKRVEAPSSIKNFRHLNIDLARGVISGEKDSRTGKPRRALLTKNEMIILSHLLEAKGEIVTRDALMTDLWNNQEYINDNALTVNISRLRSKLKSLGADDAIETRKGLGYVLA